MIHKSVVIPDDAGVEALAPIVKSNITETINVANTIKYALLGSS